MDELDILAIVITAIGWFVLLPIILRYNSEFEKLRNEPFFTIRSPQLTQSFTYLCVFAITIERTVISMANIWIVIKVPSWCIQIFLCIVWYGLLCLLAIKNYLLYFNQRHQSAIANVSFEQVYIISCFLDIYSVCFLLPYI